MEQPVAIHVKYGNYPFKIIREEGKTSIFDIIRKKYVVLTPEEKVRQAFLWYLLEQKEFPKTLTRVEMGLRLHGMTKRCDIVTFDTSGTALMIVECKHPDYALKQAAFDQAARYNLKFMVPYLVITNGHSSYCAFINQEQGTFQYLNEIPAYKDLIKLRSR